MRLLRGGESGIRTHEGLHPTAFRERHFRPLRHLSEAEYSISASLWQVSMAGASPATTIPRNALRSRCIVVATLAVAMGLFYFTMFGTTTESGLARS